MLNDSGENRHPCLVPDLGEKYSFIIKCEVSYRLL